MISLEQVKTLVKAYAGDATEQNFEEVLVGISLLDTELSREMAIQSLFKEKSKHGMSLTKIRQCVKEFTSEAFDASFFEGNTLKPIRVVNDLRSRFDYLTTVDDDMLRIYDNGVFRKDRTRQTHPEIHSLLGDNVLPMHVSNVVSLLKDITMAEIPVHLDWVNFANGRLCLRSWQLLEHSPAFQSVIQLPVVYNPKAECPVFDAWLANVLPAVDDQQLLLQLIGYSMLQDVRFGKIAVLYGPTHSGKSTCLKLVQAFLGEANVSSLTLHALDNEERRFTRSGLVGKLTNVSADLSNKYLSGDSQVKQIASGDTMTVENKGGHPFDYTPFATLWASSNELPVSHDRSDAWYERLVILPFMQQHIGKAVDRGLVGRLIESSELSGILNRVIPALRDLLTANAFIETASTQEMLAQYKIENDHVSRFLSETYERVPEGQVSEDDVYDAYKSWAEDEGIKPLSKAKCRDGVTTFLGCKRKRLGPKGGHRVYFWVGLG